MNDPFADPRDKRTGDLNDEQKDCACDLRIRLVGDGCEACNPELAAELARYARPPCLQCGAMTEDEATSRCMGSRAEGGCHGNDLWP